MNVDNWRNNQWATLLINSAVPPQQRVILQYGTAQIMISAPFNGWCFISLKWWKSLEVFESEWRCDASLWKRSFV